MLDDQYCPVANMLERTRKLKTVPMKVLNGVVERMTLVPPINWHVMMTTTQGVLNYYGRYGAPGVFWSPNQEDALSFYSADDALTVIRAMGWNQNVHAGWIEPHGR